MTPCESLEKVLTEAEIEQLVDDYTKLDLDESDRAILDFVYKLTRHAYKATSEDLEKFRNLGFSEQTISQVVFITAWFNHVNIVADAFGVGRDVPMAQEFVQANEKQTEN